MLSTKSNSRGFTIVELLIVIVVIAILAAISIVAYNGIQNRAKASSGQSLASQISKKAEAYNTIESAYPTYTQLTANDGGGSPTNPAEAELDDVNAVVDAGTSTNVDVGTDFDNGNIVGYKSCTNGAQVVWWDYAASTPVAKYIGIGGGSSSALC